MCGIGLIVSGIDIRGYDLLPTACGSGEPSQASNELAEAKRPNVLDLCGILKRRGPDHLGGANLQVGQSKQQIDFWSGLPPDGGAVHERCGVLCGLESVTNGKVNDGAGQTRKFDFLMSESQTADAQPSDISGCAKIHFIGATLQLRGEHPVTQPLQDSVGNLLVYNGEVFGGLRVREDENDTEVLMVALNGCCGCTCHSGHQISECQCSNLEHHLTVPQVLSRLKGPWAMIYWQAISQTLWFGRDSIGRRSLLIHRPSRLDSRLLLSSVAPNVREDKDGSPKYWEELACGIYSVACTAVDEFESGDTLLRDFDSATSSLSAKDLSLLSSKQEGLIGWARAHVWGDNSVRTLLAWERQHVPPSSVCLPGSTQSSQLNHSNQTSGEDDPFVVPRKSKDDQFFSFDRHHCQAGVHSRSAWDELSRPQDQEQVTNCSTSAVDNVLAALRQAVKRRTIHIHRGKSQLQTYTPTGTELIGGVKETAPIAVLFSGGLDSMILAALASEFVDADCSIDLLNVSFDGDSAPDRITAIRGLTELQEVFPSRRWRLIEIDAELSALADVRNHLEAVIYPSNTYMDLNIGTAFWLAATGTGQVRKRSSEAAPEINDGTSVAQKECTAKSEARVLLVGSGADEQCGGYGRHRTKFRLGGWEALDMEMRIDFSRIWKRNLGRDDRCIRDQGKEARFPFLDEEVISTLLRLPLQNIVDLQQPPGIGDKKILRQVALALGLKSVALLSKRAIQEPLVH